MLEPCVPYVQTDISHYVLNAVLLTTVSLI